MAESGKADFLTYRLFLTGWDTSIVSQPWAGMIARGDMGWPRQAGEGGQARQQLAGRKSGNGVWWASAMDAPRW